MWYLYRVKDKTFPKQCMHFIPRGIQKVTDDVGMLNEARLPLVHNLYKSVYFHHYVQQQHGLLCPHALQYWSQQLQHIQQLSLMLHYSSYLCLQPPAEEKEQNAGHTVESSNHSLWQEEENAHIAVEPEGMH